MHGKSIGSEFLMNASLKITVETNVFLQKIFMAALQKLGQTRCWTFQRIHYSRNANLHACQNCRRVSRVLFHPTRGWLKALPFETSYSLWILWREWLSCKQCESKCPDMKGRCSNAFWCSPRGRLSDAQCPPRNSERIENLRPPG